MLNEEEPSLTGMPGEVTKIPTQVFENSTVVGLTLTMLGGFALIATSIVVYLSIERRWSEDGLAAVTSLVIFASLAVVMSRQPLELHVTPSFIGVRQPWHQTVWINKESVEVEIYPSRWGTSAIFRVRRGVPFDGPRRFSFSLALLTEKNRGSDVTAEDILRLGIKARRHTSVLWRLF